MRIPLPTPRLLAFATALLFGFAAIPHPTAEAKPVHTSDPGNQKKNKGKNGKKGGKKGKGKNGNGKKGDNGTGPFKKKDYPVAARLRPLVLPDGMGQVGASLDISGAGGSTFVGLNADFDYGIGDVVDFGASTGLLLSPDVDWSHGIDLRLHYLAYDTKEFDFAPGAHLDFGLYSGATTVGAAVDLTGRYVLSDGFFLRFGQGALSIPLSPDFGLAVNATGGVGYQVTAPFLLYADTTLLTLLLVPDTGVTGIWETLNLDLGGQYSPTKDWDVGAQLGLANTWSVEKSLFWTLSLFGRYRF